MKTINELIAENAEAQVSIKELDELSDLIHKGWVNLRKNQSNNIVDLDMIEIAMDRINRIIFNVRKFA